MGRGSVTESLARGSAAEATARPVTVQGSVFARKPRKEPGMSSDSDGASDDDLAARMSNALSVEGNASMAVEPTPAPGTVLGSATDAPKKKPATPAVLLKRKPPPPPGPHWTQYDDDGLFWWYYEGPHGKWFCAQDETNPQPYEEAEG